MRRAKFCHLLKEHREVHSAGFFKGHKPRYRFFVFRDGNFFTLPDALQKLRKLGFRVKCSNGGYRYGHIGSLIDQSPTSLIETD